MNDESNSEPSAEAPLKLKKLSLPAWMLVSWFTFSFGLPFYAIVRNRDSLDSLWFVQDWKMSDSFDSLRFLSVVWIFWLVALLIISAVLALVLNVFWKRKNLTNRIFCIGTPVFIGTLILHSWLWPNRLEDRFAEDWHTPFPKSSSIIYARPNSGWFFHNCDAFHLRVTPLELDAIIQDKGLATTDPEEDYVQEIDRLKLPIEKLTDWKCYFLPAPEHESNDSYFRRGFAYVILVKPDRTEALFYNVYRD